MYAPTVNLLDDFSGLILCICRQPNILNDPLNEVVLERALDELVEQIRGQELMDVRTREVVCKWLRAQSACDDR